MTSHRNPDAHGKALESGENSRANGSRHSNLNAPAILQDSPPSREERGAPTTEASHGDPRFNLNLARAVCYSKSDLARFLGISIRSVDRANAAGLLPAADLVVGRSPRWSPQTIERWLRSKPRLPGRKEAPDVE